MSQSRHNMYLICSLCSVVLACVLFKVLYQGSDFFGTQIHLLPDDVNSLFTSVFLYRCLHWSCTSNHQLPICHMKNRCKTCVYMRSSLHLLRSPRTKEVYAYVTILNSLPLGCHIPSSGVCVLCNIFL